MISDGGPAFPCQVDEVLKYERKGMEVFKLSGGMSLRDWFAGMALQAVNVQAHVAEPAAANIAWSAYRIADAMLAERTKP